MSDEKPKTVKVKALQWHTYDGKAYEIGDVYDIDEQFADSVRVQGKAKAVEAHEFHKPEHKPAVKGPDKSTAVEPMKWPHK